LGGAQDPDHIKELFAQFGPVAVRRMFGGAGIFADGLMIAIAVNGTIFLKVDDQTVPRFEREGLEPFSYQTRHGTRSIKSLWRVPERLYDDPSEFSDWARDAMAAAHRAKPARKARRERR
jgi:DNA transformation protein